MKSVIWASLLLLVWNTAAFAVHANEVLITPVDAREYPVFFCDGVRQNTIQIDYAIANLDAKSDPSLVLDSLRIMGDSNFDGYVQQDSFPVGIMALASGPEYAPTGIGEDSVIITAYYGGGFVSTAVLHCRAVASPSVALYGAIPYFYYYGSQGFGGTHLQLELDTLHDQMNNNFPYHISNAPANNGENKYVELRACAGTVIDSVTFDDDFSEFNFFALPQFPLTVPVGDSVIFKYQFTPSIVGKHKRPMTLHLAGGQTLVWSFEYEVRPSADVTLGTNSGNDDLTLYPNPADRSSTLRMNSPTPFGEVIVTDVTGKRVLRLSGSSHSDVTIPTGELPSGEYRVIASSQGKTISKMLIVEH